MSLLDDLKAAAHAIDPQFQVSSNEVQGVLSALVHYTDRGDELLKAVEGGEGEVTKLLEPQPAAEPAAPAVTPAEPVATPTAPPVDVVTPAEAAPPELTDAELEAQISDLQAQLASRQATSQQTTVTHETGAEPS